MKGSKNAITKKANDMLRVRYTDEFLSDLNSLVASTGLDKSEIVRQAIHKECVSNNTISPTLKRDMSMHIINILSVADTLTADAETQNTIKKEAMDICALLNS